MNQNRVINPLRRKRLPSSWHIAALTCLFSVLAQGAAGDEDLSDDLIKKTEQEGKAVARSMYEYRLKEVEIKDKHIDLNKRTLLEGQYRYQLRAINSKFEAAFARLQSRVESLTGTRADAKRKAALIATHWHRDMYGFGTDEELDRQIATRRNLAWAAVALACLAIGWIPRRLRQPDDNSTPIEVPDDLTTITVPGLRYRVNLQTGLVMDKEMWQEVKTTTIYYQNGTFGFGSRPIETHREIEWKGKAFLLNQHGKEEVLKLTGRGHDYRPGNIVTFAYQGRGKKRSAVFAYNHATEKTEEMRGLDEAHASYWKFNLAITGILAYTVFKWAAEPMHRLGAHNGFWIGVKTVAAALVFTAAVHFSILWLRNHRFRTHYQPKFEKLLQDGMNTIQATFQRLINAQQSH